MKYKNRKEYNNSKKFFTFVILGSLFLLPFLYAGFLNYKISLALLLIIPTIGIISLVIDIKKEKNSFVKEDLNIYKEDVISYIKNELKNKNVKTNISLQEIENKKQNITLIFSGITFIDLLYIFIFHDHFVIAILIEIISLIILIKTLLKNNILNYTYKQLISRPDENINYIIENILNNKVERNNYILIRLFIFLIPIISTLIIFNKPHIIFEQENNGYAVRFYTLSVFNNQSNITIPSQYKNKNIIGIRGNVFKNLYFIENIELPDTITYINGHAFEYNYKLKNINLPTNLTKIGGYAFASTALNSINIPDTVLEIGGGAFTNCVALKEAKLPKNLTEIRGNTFEYCLNLNSITIPDKVRRIGGHAFYGCEKLEHVNISQNSQLQEIGSSAFRKCFHLNEITIPSNTITNERSFKESPTLVKRYKNEQY